MGTNYFGVNEFFKNNGTSTKFVFDQSGKLVYPPHNLFPWSEDFRDPSWQKAGVTIVPNAGFSPDGTNNAQKIVATATAPPSGWGGGRYVWHTQGEGARGTLSVYAKAGEISQICLQDYLVWYNMRLSAQAMGFDLNTGEMFRVPEWFPLDPAKASIQLIGNGWWRCSIETYDGRDCAIYPAVNQSINFTGDGVMGVYLWGAANTRAGEVNDLPEYVPTAGAVRSNLALEYDPITQEAVGVVCEPSRTNYCRWSRAFGNAAWYKPPVMVDRVEPNRTRAPNGKLEGDYVVEAWYPLPMQKGCLFQFIPTSVGIQGVLSVYAKASDHGEQRSQIVLVDDPVPGQGRGSVAGFDLVTGEIFHPIWAPRNDMEHDYWADTPHSPDPIIRFVGNGWWRCSIPVTACDMVYFYFAKDKVTNYVSNGPPAEAQAASDKPDTQHVDTTGRPQDGLYLWGAQLEASDGTVPTSYIVTAFSEVTRAEDQINFTPDQINYGQRHLKKKRDEDRVESMPLSATERRFMTQAGQKMEELVPGWTQSKRFASSRASDTASEEGGSWWVEWSARRVITNARLIGYTTDDASPMGQSFDSMKLYDDTVLEHPVAPTRGELHQTASAYGPSPNLLVPSNDLTVPPWDSQNSTITAVPDAAPAGQSGAVFKLADTAVVSKCYNMWHNDIPFTVGGRYSVYAKAAELSTIFMQAFRTYGFDLATGQAFPVADPGHPTIPCLDPRIEDAGGGWFRCSIDIPNNAWMSVGLMKGGEQYYDGIGEGVLLFGPQLTEGTEDLAYMATPGGPGERVITMNGAEVAKDYGSTNALAAPGTHIFLGNGGSTPINGHIRRVYYVPRRQSDEELRGNTAPTVVDPAPTP